MRRKEGKDSGGSPEAAVQDLDLMSPDATCPPGTRALAAPSPDYDATDASRWMAQGRTPQGLAVSPRACDISAALPELAVSVGVKCYMEDSTPNKNISAKNLAKSGT